MTSHVKNHNWKESWPSGEAAEIRRETILGKGRPGKFPGEGESESVEDKRGPKKRASNTPDRQSKCRSMDLDVDSR